MAMMMLRNSERATWKRCRHRWEWTYLGERQAREASNALRFGDLVHRSLAPYYKPGRKRGPHPAQTFERLYHEQAKERMEGNGFNVFSDEKWVKALDLGIGMLEGYVAHYADEDKNYEVVSSEQTFQLPLLVPELRVVDPSAGALILPPFRFKIVGTFDGLWRHLPTGRLHFKEFKTAASIKLDGLPLDEQAGLYWTYGPRFMRRQGLLKDGELPVDILYTFLRKAVSNPDWTLDANGAKLNKDGSISKVQPAPFFKRVPVYRDEGDRWTMHNRVLAEAREIQLARAGSELMKLYKNPGPLHMPNCLGCPVREACEVHETGGDWRPTLDAITAPWNPYAAHELPERG